MNDVMVKTVKRARRIVVAVIGTSVVLIGIVMIALPGPGLLVILAGLAILATEFVWAGRLLRKVREKAPWFKKGREE
jgi:tellurite resistance protein TerC